MAEVKVPAVLVGIEVNEEAEHDLAAESDDRIRVLLLGMLLDEGLTLSPTGPTKTNPRMLEGVEHLLRCRLVVEFREVRHPHRSLSPPLDGEVVGSDVRVDVHVVALVDVLPPITVVVDVVYHEEPLIEGAPPQQREELVVIELVELFDTLLRQTTHDLSQAVGEGRSMRAHGLFSFRTVGVRESIGPQFFWNPLRMGEAYLYLLLSTAMEGIKEHLFF